MSQLSVSDLEAMEDNGTLVGVFDNIPDEVYHNGPGVSRSDLKEILRSPLHAKYRWDNPKETDAMDMGKAFHCLVLEPDKFKKTYVQLPEEIESLGNRKTIDKEIRAAYEAEISALKQISLDAVTWTTIHNMRDRLMTKSKATWLLRDGIAERTYYWIDEDTGLLCKCRADWTRNNPVLVDLKSCRCAQESAVRGDLWDYGYYLQVPFYIDGATKASGRPFNAFTFVCVENIAPHGVAVYNCDHGPTIKQGRMDYKRALQIYHECLLTDNWPDYPDEVNSIGLYQSKIVNSI